MNNQTCKLCKNGTWATNQYNREDIVTHLEQVHGVTSARYVLSSFINEVK